MKRYMDLVRAEKPLIHCITNYVTVNDCANILLACGGSPIMADAPEEVEEIAAICSGLVLNIGTLNERTIRSMFSAGRTAKKLHHPVILDPVGAGASKLRTETALSLLKDLRPDIVRCNISELKMLLNDGTGSRGVDASELDRVTDENLDHAAEMLRCFSRKHDCITAVSGALDLICSPDGTVCVVRNGVPMMASITGSGCMLTAVTAAYAAVVSGQELFPAVCAAFSAMGIAGETALKNLTPEEGNASFRNRLIDAFFTADPEKWEWMVRNEML